MIGRVLARYRVVAQLGAGGMGVVYRARDETLERDIALKVLPAGALSDEAARARFRKEALALSQLNHPHICTIHEVGEAEGVSFIAMELVEGRPPGCGDRSGRTAGRDGNAVRRANRRCPGPRP